MSRLITMLILTACLGCGKYRDGYLTVNLVVDAGVRDARAVDGAAADEEQEDDDDVEEKR